MMVGAGFVSGWNTMGVDYGAQAEAEINTRKAVTNYG